MSLNVTQFESALRARYGSQYRKGWGKNGLEFKICCPFCLRRVGKIDRKYRLYMNPSRDQYRCFRCDVRGVLSALFGDIKWIEQTTFTQAITVLQGEVDPPGAMVALTDLPEDHVASRYLQGRGFDIGTLNSCFGMRFCYDGRKFANGLFDTTNTIVIPVWMGGKLVGWQARLLYNPDELTDDECRALGFTLVDEDGELVRPPKYFTSPGMDKGQVMFNYDMARQSEIVVAAEGPFDVVGIGPSGVATFGKGVSMYQARLLKAYWRLVVVMLDPGDADAEMNELYRSIELSVRVLRVKLQGYKDPGEAPTREIWRQIDAEAQRRGIDLQTYNWGPYWDRFVMRK